MTPDIVRSVAPASVPPAGGRARCTTSRVASTPAAGLWFTFDVEAGALRRSFPDELATTMAQIGADVSWIDAKSGRFGVRRRFTVRGSQLVIRTVINEIAATLGWQPGAIALP